LSRCYLDTNFLYAHLRAPRGSAAEPVEAWRGRVLGELDAECGVISPLVLDELAYRLILTWLRDDGEADPLGAYRTDPRSTMRSVRRRLAATWKAIDSLALELHPTDQAVVEHAKALMAKPGLAPRDAFHTAHAVAAGCGVIASSDAAFDQVPSLKRLAP
jgi:predicted nucleic acid-binding protein